MKLSLRRPHCNYRGCGRCHFKFSIIFSYHVLWPQGFSGHFDIVAALITVAAFIALFRFNVNVLYVIFASALVGLAVTFF